mgnify:CR=1 FL=1
MPDCSNISRAIRTNGCGGITLTNLTLTNTNMKTETMGEILSRPQPEPFRALPWPAFLAEVEKFIEPSIRLNLSRLIPRIINKNVISLDSELELYSCTDDDGEEIEVYEHWAIDDALADDLQELGETIVFLPELDVMVWCRTCTGQSIYLDDVIQSVAVERLNIRIKTNK